MFFHEADIWWVHLGVNVGYQIDGKQADFSRPVVIIKKYNQYSFLPLPLTTNAKPSKWRIPIGKVGDEQARPLIALGQTISRNGLNAVARSLALIAREHRPDEVLAVRKACNHHGGDVRQHEGEGYVRADLMPSSASALWLAMSATIRSSAR